MSKRIETFAVEIERNTEGEIVETDPNDLIDTFIGHDDWRLASTHVIGNTVLYIIEVCS